MRLLWFRFAISQMRSPALREISAGLVREMNLLLHIFPKGAGNSLTVSKFEPFLECLLLLAGVRRGIRGHRANNPYK